MSGDDVDRPDGPVAAEGGQGPGPSRRRWRPLAAVIAAVLVASALAVAIASRSGPGDGSPLPSAAPGEGLVEKVRLSGTGGSKSQVVELEGRGGRIRWTSRAASFYAYLVEDEMVLEENGAFPEAECTQACDGSSELVTSYRGRYYVDVRASGGPWEVIVEELA